jgi:hypothetical protein
MFIGKFRKSRLIDGKSKRMPFMTANGLLILVSCAMCLYHWASFGQFGARFYMVQTLELLAGATNVTLLALNIRDRLHLAGRSPCPLPAAEHLSRSELAERHQLWEARFELRKR